MSAVKPAKADDGTTAKVATATVFMVGDSRGAKDGDRRTVPQETADALVASGLARYVK